MELGYVIFIIAVMLFYLILGCVLDLFGTFILTVPILFSDRSVLEHRPGLVRLLRHQNRGA
ncbi:TRAP transporter large permease subunit [Lutimaribacter pacificus]